MKPRHCFLPAIAANDAERVDLRTLRLVLGSLERRGRALADFCSRIRERGGFADTEEQIDLPRLRAQWLAVRDRLDMAGGA